MAGGGGVRMGMESNFPILFLHFLMLAKIGPVAESQGIIIKHTTI